MRALRFAYRVKQIRPGAVRYHAYVSQRRQCCELASDRGTQALAVAE
jgi:hypothetical protein